MENNFDNLTPDTEDISVFADAVSDDAATVVSEADEAVALAEEYTASADILENLPELQESKKAKKAKKEKAPKAKKEKAPKEKKEKAPKAKKEKTPKVAMSEDEKAKRILSKRKKFHFMNFSRRLAVMCIIPLIVLVIVITLPLITELIFSKSSPSPYSLATLCATTFPQRVHLHINISS